jgi:hypothetical protein
MTTSNNNSFSEDAADDDIDDWHNNRNLHTFQSENAFHARQNSTFKSQQGFNDKKD